jgi:hypothetical protein
MKAGSWELRMVDSWDAKKVAKTDLQKVSCSVGALADLMADWMVKL